MILVDSSAIVSYLRADGEDVGVKFGEVLAHGLRFGIEPHVFQEVLQGARDDREWRELDTYLSTQSIYGLTRGLESHRDAARIYFDCRRRGLTIRSIVDCLVAQVALEHDLALLARDRDYASIARVRHLRFW